ncbi:MAG TPA: GNAT family N-acetyltransferase [Egibacteraceae bacterium]|nr:GNAT family N-acetyltransferase [Egibacteraceae bacterium]
MRTGLDDWLPTACVRTRHERVVDCSPHDAIATALQLPVAPDWIVRALFRIRGFGAGAEPLAQFTSSNGFIVLEQTPTAHVFGIAGRLLGGRRLAHDPQSWRSWSAPGVKIAAEFRASVTGAGQSLLTTETRVHALDPVSHAVFHLYWLLVGPFSRLIRRRWLRAIAAHHGRQRTASRKEEITISRWITGDSAPGVQLREVADDDVAVFYAHQREAEGNRMAGFGARDQDAHFAHWRKIMADDSVVKRTIVLDGQVVGNIVSFPQDGQRQIGYWIGQEHWGKGIATQALSLFVGHVVEPPLLAHVAAHNIGSIRVLEKCGFVQTGEQAADHEDVGELVFTFEPNRS